MGHFSELAIDVIEMYQKDGLKEADIARITGATLEQVHEILADFEDSDYSVSDTDADDGQPTMYEEYQDLYGGDDWDQGQYETEY